MHHLSHPKYRADIDGLRALAVLFVVFFHGFPTVLRGGFIGVDVFFVISGFLITTILIENLTTGEFRFGEFYERRIRRIFPALCLVLLAALGLGWIALLPDEFEQLGKHIASSAVFGTNFTLWGESGYFDNASDTKPLLHLWSLAIEEQFYLIYPIAIWLAYRCKNRVLLCITVLLVCSLGINFYLGSTNRVADFYCPASRFWELLAGGLIAYGVHKRPPWFQKTSNSHAANAISWLGFVLLTVGVLTIKREDAFPYWRALVPVLGACCLIWAGPQAFFNRQVLSTRVLRLIGLISYPLYLWHWILLVFVRILKGEYVSPGTRLSLIAISILLAWLTYKLIERPLRYGKLGKQKTIGLAGCLLALGLIGFYVYKNSGIPDRSVVSINRPLNSGYDGGDQGYTTPGCSGQDLPMFGKLFGSCAQDKREAAKLLLLGDSKSEVLFDALVRTSQPGGRWMLIGGNGTSGSFAPILTNNPIYERHQQAAQMALQIIRNNPNLETIVIASATRVLFKITVENNLDELPATKLETEVIESMDRFISELVKTGKRVVLILDNPTLPPPKDCQDRTTTSNVLNWLLQLQHNPECEKTLDAYYRETLPYRRALQDVSQKHNAHVEIFDTIPYLCDTNTEACPAWMNDKALYSYSDHLSDYGAGLIALKVNQMSAHKSMGTQR